jgi:hypothetical protein
MKELIDSWLTPEGEIIEVGSYGHNSFASEYLIKELGEIEYYNLIMCSHYDYDYVELHKRGWIRIKYNTAYLPRIEIMGNTIDYTKPMRNTMSPAMNETQMAVALWLCVKCNTTLHMAINPKCFW